MVRALSQERSASPSLKEVSALFEQWRSTRAKKSRIPETLWQQVTPLFNKYPIGEISKTLKLSGGQLKTKMRHPTRIAKRKRKSSELAFVPVNIPQTIEEAGIGKIEIRRTDGVMLSIERLNQTTLIQLITKFVQGL